MANEIKVGAQTGLALQARLMSGAAQVGSTITLAESPSGHYTGSVAGGTAAGDYVVQIVNVGTVVASGLLRWDGSAEVLPALPGASMALTAGERTSTAAAVWASATRTLSSVGTLVSDIWASATRTLTADPGASSHAATQAAISGKPSLAQIEASAVLAKEATSGAIKAKTDALPAAPAAAGDAMALTTGERTTTVAAVWASATRTITSDPGAAAHATTQAAIAALPDPLDATATQAAAAAALAAYDPPTKAELDAAVASVGVDEGAIADAVRAELSVELGRIDAAVSTRESEASAATRHTANITEHDATQTTLASGTVRANVVQIAGVGVQGAGVSGDKWRPS